MSKWRVIDSLSKCLDASTDNVLQSTAREFLALWTTDLCNVQTIDYPFRNFKDSLKDRLYLSESEGESRMKDPSKDVNSKLGKTETLADEILQTSLKLVNAKISPTNLHELDVSIKNFSNSRLLLVESLDKLIPVMDKIGSRINHPNMSDDCARFWQTAFDKWSASQTERQVLESSLEDYRAKVAVTINEYGVKHWADPGGLSPCYLRESHFNFHHAPAMDPMDTHVSNYFEYSNYLRKSINEVTRATVSNGTVVYPPNVRASDWWYKYSTGNLWRTHQRTFIPGNEFEIKIFTALSVVMEFCGRVRSISLALLELHNARPQRESQLEAASKIYNAYSRTMVVVRDVLEKYSEVLKLLKDVVQIEKDITLSIQDLQGLLKSGEGDYIEAETKTLQGCLRKFEIWYKSMSELSYAPRSSASVGGTVSRIHKPVTTKLMQNDEQRLLIYGWKQIDITSNTMVRAATQSTGGQEPHVYTWGDTMLFGAETTSLAIPKADLRHVEFDQTPERAFKLKEGTKDTYTLWINFKKPFEKAPLVACWFTCVDFYNQVALKAEAIVLETSTTGALLGVRVWEQTDVANLRLNWIAYNASPKAGERISVVRGDIGGPGITDAHLWGKRLTTPNRGKFLKFPGGTFEEAPKVMIGLYSFSFLSRDCHRIDLGYDHVTKDGLWIQADTWMGTGLIDAKAVVIAFA